MRDEEIRDVRQSSVSVMHNKDDAFEFYLSSYFNRIIVNKEQLHDLMMIVIMIAKRTDPSNIFKDVYGRDLSECYLCGKVLKDEAKKG